MTAKRDDAARDALRADVTCYAFGLSLTALKSALSKFEKTAANLEPVEERAHQATPATQESASTDLVKDAAADLREARKLIDESR